MDERPGKSGAQGRVLALDIGAKRVGVAISDELRITVRALAPIQRGSWKQLLQRVKDAVSEFDACAMVIGLPLQLNGAEGDAAAKMRGVADKFRLSLSIPVHLHDERLTTFAARESLRVAVSDPDEIARRVDSEAAAIILRDFIESD